MNYDQIVDEILSYAKMQQQKDVNGEYKISINSLLKYFERKFPELDSRPIYNMIDEIDARGWLLKRNSSFLIFDPASF
jgi:hypothetical protein